MVEWTVISSTLVFAIVLVRFPVVAASAVLVFSTLDGLVVPAPWGDISATHLGLISVFPSLLLYSVTQKIPIDEKVLIAIYFLVIGIGISSAYVILTPGVLTHLLKLLVYIWVFWCLSRCNSLIEQRLWVNTSVGCIILSVILSFFRVLYQENPSGLHLSGGFTDWNYYAVFLCAWVPIVWVFTYTESDIKKQQWFYVLAVILCVLIVGTRSKSGLLLLLITLSTLFVLGLAPRQLLLWAIPVGLFGLIYLFRGGEDGFDIGQRINKVLKQPRLQERLSNWRLMADLIAQSPLVGVGIHQYEPFVTKWMGPQPFGVSRMYSGFLVLVVESGIFAGFGYCAVFVNQIYQSLSQQTIENKAYCCALLVLGTSTVLVNSHEHLFTWSLLGWIAASMNKERVEDSIAS